MAGMLVLVVLVACLCGWRAIVGDVPAWVMWVVYVYVCMCALFRFGVIYLYIGM